MVVSTNPQFTPCLSCPPECILSISPAPIAAPWFDKGKARELEATFSPPKHPQGPYFVFSSQQGPELDPDSEGFKEAYDNWNQEDQLLDTWPEEQDEQVECGRIWDQDEQEGNKYDHAQDSPPKHGRRLESKVWFIIITCLHQITEILSYDPGFISDDKDY